MTNFLANKSGILQLDRSFIDEIKIEAILKYHEKRKMKQITHNFCSKQLS
jgi:hypothetical protein